MNTATKFAGFERNNCHLLRVIGGHLLRAIHRSCELSAMGNNK